MTPEKSTSGSGADEKIETWSSLENGTPNNNEKILKSPAEKKLVRKINYTFMPLVILILFVQVRIIMLMRAEDIIKMT